MQYFLSLFHLEDVFSEYLLTSQETSVPQKTVWECWSRELRFNLQVSLQFTGL